MNQPALRLSDKSGTKSPAWRSMPLLLMAVVSLNFFFLLLFAKTKSQEVLVERARLSQTAAEEERMINGLYSELDLELKSSGIGRKVELKRIPGGMSITLPEANFFARGQIDLNKQAERELAVLAAFVNAKRDLGFWVVAEGHTDDSAVESGKMYYRTNWELSGARAADALRVFLEAGFPQNRAMLIGFGDARPVVANRDEAGKNLWMNQTKNRRVVVKLLRPTWLSGIFSDSAPPK